MSTKVQGTALVGGGAAACVACCAGPILGFLAAIGLGTVAGIAVFGALGLVVAASGVFIVVLRWRSPTCASNDEQPVAVEISNARSPVTGSPQRLR